MKRSGASANHSVWFYEETAHLVAKVAAFAAEGLRAGEQVILIATNEHLRAIEATLDVSGAESTNLLVFDANAALAAFHYEGGIDRAAFDNTIGAIIRDAATHGNVRAFGEMVALLWSQGAVREAIELETLWSELGETEAFSLLCAYPAEFALDVPADTVCALHSEIHLGDRGQPTTSMRVYPGTFDAVREARRFVRACLGDDQPGIEDALLVTSELSSNAVRHARSTFAVHVTLADGAVRVGVRDTSPVAPRLLPMTATVETGRGIATVAAVSKRWGIESHRVGKTVWAEVPLPV